MGDRGDTGEKPGSRALGAISQGTWENALPGFSSATYSYLSDISVVWCTSSRPVMRGIFCLALVLKAAGAF